MVFHYGFNFHFPSDEFFEHLSCNYLPSIYLLWDYLTIGQIVQIFCLVFNCVYLFIFIEF